MTFAFRIVILVADENLVNHDFLEQEARKRMKILRVNPNEESNLDVFKKGMLQGRK